MRAARSGTRLASTGIAALALMVVFAAVFAKERMYFADAACAVFQIVNSHALFIESGRYGEFLTQWIPWCGSLCHWPLGFILVFHAVFFNLIYLGVAVALVYWLRQWQLALVMSLYYFLFVSASAMCENDAFVAVAYLFMEWGVLCSLAARKASPIWIAILFVLWSMLTISTHFIIIIPFVFLFVCLAADRTFWPFSRSMTWVLGGLLACIIAGKFLVTLYGRSYDNAHLQGVAHMTLNDLLHAATSKTIGTFVRLCGTNYWVATAVMIAGFAANVYQRKYFQLAWTLVATVGYLLLLGVTYQDSDLLLWHIELEWAGLGIIFAFPLVFSVLPLLRARWALLALAAIFAVRLYYIVASVPAYTARIRFEEGVLRQMREKGIHKLALYRTDSLSKGCILDWAVPMESLLLSKVAGDSPQLTFCFVDRPDTARAAALGHARGYFEAYSIHPVSYLNPVYFYVDTTRGYQVMEYEVFTKHLPR